jgi:hypothetical protein
VVEHLSPHSRNWHRVPFWAVLIGAVKSLLNFFKDQRIVAIQFMERRDDVVPNVKRLRNWQNPVRGHGMKAVCIRILSFRNVVRV